VSSELQTLKRHLKPAFLIALGIWLLITALQFAGLNDTTTSSTKVENAAVGGAIGAGVGLGTYLIVGGIGVATGGIGFALGAVALTALGTGAGALTGAATGETTVVLYSYPTWLWATLIVSGCAALYAAYIDLRRHETSAGSTRLVSPERSSSPTPRLPASARVLAILLVGVLVGTSTLTKRRPPPAPVLENVVFRDNGLLKRGMERIRWNGRKKQITSKFSGDYLQADKMTFREVDGKWQEQQPAE
jgi:hypothetical protein